MDGTGGLLSHLPLGDIRVANRLKWEGRDPVSEIKARLLRSEHNRRSCLFISEFRLHILRCKQDGETSTLPTPVPM